MTAAVSDAGPLVALSQIGRDDLLPSLYPRVLIPPLVAADRGRHPSGSVRAAATRGLGGSLFPPRSVASPLPWRSDRGRYPWGSGIRTSRPGLLGTALTPQSLSHRHG